VKKTLLLLAAVLTALSLTPPTFADGNPRNSPGKTASLSTVLADGNPFCPPRMICILQ